MNKSLLCVNRSLWCADSVNSVLQCGCSALQCVAVCCSVLQCVAVCCSVLQCQLEIKLYRDQVVDLIIPTDAPGVVT